MLLSIEKLNRLLYNSKARVHSLLNLLTYINSFAAFSLLTYVYGFYLTSSEVSSIFIFLNAVILLYTVIYLVRLLYAFQRITFLRNTIVEIALMGFLVYNGVSYYFFNSNVLYILSQLLGYENVGAFYEVATTLLILLLVGIEVSKVSTRISGVRLKPAVTLIYSFLLIIAMGTGLLMLPAMTNSPSSMAFLEALFTAVSATCVTGLIVVDTATYFTFKGQVVILFLIQIGGIGMVTFATFFALFLKEGVGIKHQSIMQSFLSTESLFSARGLLRQIVLLTLLIESIGFVAIFFAWGREVEFESLGQKLFFSIFHAVSSFCSAGFSLYTNGLYEQPLQRAYILQLVIALLIILGSLGFSSLMDLFSISSLRERLAKPWKDWKLNTKISVYVSFGLIVFGMVIFFILEKNNTLAGLNLMESLIASFFQSVTRTTGFNTVDVTNLHVPTLILLMFLMFIGSSPGSTGGGIKTTTFYIIALSVISSIRGKKIISIDKRTIPNDLLFKAYSVITFAAAYNLVALFILSITEPDLNILHVFFEQVSAFGTVGLSVGIAPQLSAVGKVVLIISMFLGRVGTLTIALAVSRQVISNAYQYPNAYLMVG
ncbi:potassium transporter TrkG [Rhodocytophaga aerolata]|uniref:Potassium transporter TrkG n=1 Tax=Rhodocytophaga aerolata TaxID=455078 RepID=A0ABT8RCN3_9BACT|nr:potassium transporter TrkG [Rhodocytophaga aerolata]MDO1449866.1 potassium transporter TrkG [Rhodocytophaga aerolata]